MSKTNANTLEKKKRIPHIYALLFLIIMVCMVATWFLPAGEFERVVNEAGRTVVVPGTYHRIDQTPVGFFNTLQAIYAGMNNAAGVVFFVFISFACIQIIISSGAFNGLVAGLLRVLKGKARVAIIPIFIALIGAASSTIGVFEETLPFIPIFIGIAIAMGYDAIVGLAIVALGAGIGYSGAAINPFTVGVAQGIAEVAPLSGTGFRVFSHAIMVIVGSIYTMRYAMKIQADPSKSLVKGDDFSRFSMSQDDLENHNFGIREKLVLLTLAAGIVAIVYGCKVHHWYFSELCAVFIIMALVCSVIMGWGPNTIAEKIAGGFTEIAMACMMIGLARGILMVLQDGHIIDTIVYGFSVPLSYLPRWLAGEAMLLFQTCLNFLIPSGSGQAATSMPIMAPLADILGISRQVAVLAFQFGDGLSNILWPTAFAPVICGISGVKVEKWWKWFIPCFIALLLTQMALIALAIFIGWA